MPSFTESEAGWLDESTHVPGLRAEQRVGEGRFILLQKLGQGGMGVVWLAIDRTLGQAEKASMVALKFLAPAIADDPRAFNLMRQEVLNSRRLHHHHIVSIYELHTYPDEPPFVCMEYVAGKTLHQMVQSEPGGFLRWPQLMPWMKQLCDALEYAHREGMVHRDLKPSNLLINERSELKLADFGLARAAVARPAGAGSRPGAGGGTLFYSSPQQLQGEGPQFTDDVYSFGATLYELLTGTPPFRGATSEEIAQQILNDKPETIPNRLSSSGRRNPVPGHVKVAVSACLEKESLPRPQTVKDMAHRLGLGLEHGIEVEPKAPMIVQAPSDWTEGTSSQSQRRAWPLIVRFLVLACLMVAAYWVINSLSPPGWLEAKVKVTSAVASVVRIVRTVLGEESSPLTNGVPSTNLIEEPRQAGTLTVVVDPGDAKLTLTNLTTGAAVASLPPLVSGKLVLRSLPPADYVLWASKTDYDTVHTNFSLANGGAMTVTLQLRAPGQPLSSSEGTLELEAAGFASYQIRGFREPGSLFAADKIESPKKRNTREGLIAGAVALALPVGDYLVEVCTPWLPKLPGTLVAKRIVSVRRGETTRVVFRIKSYMVSLKVNAEAKLHRIDVEGVSQELPTFKVKSQERYLFQDEVLAGDYAYRFVCPLFQPQQTNVSIPLPGKQEIEVTLVPSLWPQPRFDWTNSLDMKLIYLGGFGPLKAPGSAAYDLWMGETEVTVANYEKVVKGTPREKPEAAETMRCLTYDGRKELQERNWLAPGFGQEPNHPVVGVSWRAAQEFCARLTALERESGCLTANQSYRLPKDEEWSYAAGEGVHRFPWGGDSLAGATNGNYAGREVMGGTWPQNYSTHEGGDGFPRTAPAKSFPPNRFGFYNLGGNVAEWCDDWYSTALNKELLLRLDPRNPLREDGGGQTYRVLRGASWFDHYDWELETATRNRALPEARDDRYGFRVVLVEQPGSQ